MLGARLNQHRMDHTSSRKNVTARSTNCSIASPDTVSACFVIGSCLRGAMIHGVAYDWRDSPPLTKCSSRISKTLVLGVVVSRIAVYS